MMTCRNIFPKDKEYKALIRRLDDTKTRFKSRPDKITGIYLELAEYLKNSLFLVDKAEQNYEKVISWGRSSAECSYDCSLAYRSLAEIAIEREDYDSAIKKIAMSLDFAYKTENPGLIQQALHQRAHICMSCGLPEKALAYAEECAKFLEANAEEIDALRKDGNSNCRMAHLQNFMAAIYLEIQSSVTVHQYNYGKKALELNEKAAKYASEHENWSLLYRTLLMKLELTTGKERVSIAQSLCNAATKVVPTKVDENKFKKEAKCHLSLEKLRNCEQGNFGESKVMLWKRYEELKKEPNSVSEDLFEAVKRALTFIYKAEQRIKKANSMNLKDNAMRRRAQMVIFEKIGDDASFLGMNEIALTFYQRMLKSADRADDKRKAWCSMAESAKDCQLWARALDFYTEVKALEQQLGYDEQEMIDTDIAIAIVSAEVEQIPPEHRLNKFRKVYRDCRTPEQKLNILIDYLKFMRVNSSLCADGEYQRKLEEKAFLDKKLGKDGWTENDGQIGVESTERDEFDEMDEQQMLFEIAREMKIMDRNEKIVKERANKNNYGESNLHEIARSGEYQQLKELIERGYDVNQMDHGGWTPLSEAVSAQNLANVRLLLTKGANPNTRSKEFLMDEEQTKITSGGLTPLMETCSVGNIEIGKMLLQFKARASAKDDDDWTALEYLNEFMMNNTKEMDEQQEEKLRKFGDLIKHRQAEEGLSSRTYEDFLELLQQKRASIQRNSQRKSSKNSLNSLTSESNHQRKRKRQISDDSDDEIGDFSTGQLGKENSRNAWISDGEEDHGEEADSEETRNLLDYRRCIVGLMRKRNGQSEECQLRASKTPPLLFKRREMASSKKGLSTKRLFFK